MLAIAQRRGVGGGDVHHCKILLLYTKREYYPSGHCGKLEMCMVNRGESTSKDRKH